MGLDGNFGFQDQKMALQWVRDNIEHFGGNKDGIVLFGQSAGALDCCLHLVDGTQPWLGGSLSLSLLFCVGVYVRQRIWRGYGRLPEPHGSLARKIAC